MMTVVSNTSPVTRNLEIMNDECVGTRARRDYNDRLAVPWQATSNRVAKVGDICSY